MEKCKKCGGIKICYCDMIDTSQGADSPDQIPKGLKMNTQKEKVEPKEEETPAEFLKRLGIDGNLWAEEFMKIWGGKLEEIEVGLMTSWFCNAIMAGYDARRRLDNEID